MTTITNTDREAAASLVAEWQAFTGDMTGDAEHAFARHREQAIEEAAASFADLTVKWEGHARGDAFAMANARIRALIGEKK